MQVIGNMASPPPFIGSVKWSICNKLISLGALQPHWLHTDHALSISCLCS